ncbi:MAG TPA: hypothetical protein VII02_11725 [Gemmatimonadaceae bacterium]
MTRNKDLKRLVRARMTKTGEAYTAARAQITKKSATKTDTGNAAGCGGVLTPRPTPIAVITGLSPIAFLALRPEPRDS